MDLVLFGMQGSGKGTQAGRLVQNCGFVLFEAGAALRSLATQESELAKKVQEIMHAGNLVPTEVIMEIIADFVQQLPAGKRVLFDGIPRSLDQMELFDALMQKEGREFLGLNIQLTEEEALTRLTTRRICESCKSTFPSFYTAATCENCGGKLITRHDDTPEAIRTRLQTFAEKTIPVIQSYQAQGKMLTVNGQQSIEEVHTEISQVLKPHFECP